MGNFTGTPVFRVFSGNGIWGRQRAHVRKWLADRGLRHRRAIEGGVDFHHQGLGGDGLAAMSLLGHRGTADVPFSSERLFGEAKNANLISPASPV
jgi:hypothetical protein